MALHRWRRLGAPSTLPRPQQGSLQFPQTRQSGEPTEPARGEERRRGPNARPPPRQRGRVGQLAE
eukprot:14776395-Alexandrium_andersonii.AAC.1